MFSRRWAVCVLVLGLLMRSSFGQPSSPPTISDIPNQTIAANATTSPVPFSIGDAETPATNLALTASSSNTNLIGNIVFSGSGSNRAITIIPRLNTVGTGVVTVTVTDANGGSASDNVGLTVSLFSAAAAGSIPNRDQSNVAWGDYDNDGKLDFLLTYYDTN